MPRFLIVIEKANGNFAAYSPDLPGCASTGKTVEAVKRNMLEAIKLHLEWLREEELPIPDSQSLAEYIDFPAEQIGSISDEVRAYAKEKYVDPARRDGRSQVKIRTGDVHKALGLRSRVPLVCQALRSHLFEELAGVSRVEPDEGPPSGFGARVVMTFRLQE